MMESIEVAFQTGITRSWNLWMELLKIQNDKTRFLLTEESMDQVNVRNQSGGMYSIPNYENGVIDIISELYST